MPIEVAFAQVLLKRRHALGLTQAQAARSCVISQSVATKKSNGRRW